QGNTDMSSTKNTLNPLLVQITYFFVLVFQFTFLLSGLLSIAYQEYDIALDFLSYSLFPVIYIILNFILVRTPIYKKVKANQ
ncbi:hypothetical protein QL989_18925, partial [Pseudoalteromonas sp. APC 3224]|uniref:hypothetical protein n=1 Tax=Pseudoalteromonas sp. APC 3224 TaxID=3035203 RepID=UPI0025B534BF